MGWLSGRQEKGHLAATAGVAWNKPSAHIQEGNCMSRFQNGSLLKIKRRNGEQVWAFRWYEDAGGSRSYRKRIIGTVKQLPERRDAERAVSNLRNNINEGVQTPQTVADLAAHYQKHELTPERKSF